jgi:hypothetical protein
MPWPHKNSDGKAILGHDENGVKKPPTTPKFNLDQLLSTPLHGINKIEQNSFHNGAYFATPEGPIPIDPGMSYQEVQHLQQLFYHGLMSKTEFYNKLYGKQDPILIKAKHPIQSIKWEESIYTTVGPPNVEVMRQRVSVSVGKVLKTVEFNSAINTTRDYRESDIRQMLMKGFQQITDKIIEELKEQNK